VIWLQSNYDPDNRSVHRLMQLAFGSEYLRFRRDARSSATSRVMHPPRRILQ
jgi:hypothetical protein